MTILRTKISFTVRKLAPSLLSIFFTNICLPCLAQDEVVFRTLLLRGLSERNQPVSKTVEASNDEVMKLTIRPDFHNPEENIIESAKDAIRSVYGFPNPLFLTSAYMIWDGKQENITEMVYEDHDIFPVRIWPRSLSSSMINVRIEGLKFEFKEISFLDERSHTLRVRGSRSYTHLFVEPRRIEDSVGYEKWLDQELTIAFQTTVLIHVPGKDSTVFLLLQAYRKDDKRMDAGLVGNRLLSYSLGGTDPVCRKKIGQGDGYEPSDKPQARLVYEGQSYYFCSDECLNLFKKDPEKYLKIIPDQIRAFKKNEQYHETNILFRPSVLIVPGYPDTLRNAESEGMIKLEFDIDEMGKVRQTRVLDSANIGYEKILQDTLSQWTFPRKAQNNQPMPFSVPIDLIFESKNTRDQVVQNNQPEFSAPSSALMAKVTDYCAKLENAALYFVCSEKIVEKLEPGWQLAQVWAKALDPFEKDPLGGVMFGSGISGEKNSYAYDYQVIRKEGQISEKRILLEENGKTVPDDGNYPKTYRFYVNKAIYGPIGLLDRAEQSFYDYGQLKDENVDGRKAYVIDIRPKKPSSIKPIYGKAWIDQNDGSILKMSIEAESLAGYERISADYESLGVKPLISIEIVYGFEKNGLRFPSQIILKEAYRDPRKGKIKISEMTVDYSRYKFFTVGTEVKY
jgi:YHS domain-containing protein